MVQQQQQTTALMKIIETLVPFCFFPSGLSLLCCYWTKFAWASIEKQYISSVTVLDVQTDDCSLDFILLYGRFKIQLMLTVIINPIYLLC